MALQIPSAGELRDRLRFERRQKVADGYGNSDGLWLPMFAPRRGKLAPTRGGDQVIAARAQGVSSWDLWIRWDVEAATVAPGDRVVDTRDERRVFKIVFAQDMQAGKRAWLLLQLELGGAVG